MIPNLVQSLPQMLKLNAGSMGLGARHTHKHVPTSAGCVCMCICNKWVLLGGCFAQSSLLSSVENVELNKAQSSPSRRKTGIQAIDYRY